MPTAANIRWFKEQFGERIAAAVKGTPFDVDMLTAIACQETGYIWSVLRTRNLSLDRVAALCVGDTIDWNPATNKGRKAFPRTKAALVAVPRGEEMFAIAREALVEMAKVVPGFGGAVNNPNKFCHGFGIFQLDLQFFKTEPDFFLERRWADFDVCIGRAVGELQNAMKRIGLANRPTLTDGEMAAVAIAYNTGGYNPAKGLAQGHFDGTRYYGQLFADFLRLSRTVEADAAPATIESATVGQAAVPPPTPISATGPLYVVDVEGTPLRLRSEPRIPKEPTANVIGRLPDGHVVRAVTDQAVKGFLEVETSLQGAHFQGFVATKYLVPAAGAVTSVEVATPAASQPTTGIVAAHLPRKSGSITTRKDLGRAYSLNEPSQPTRTGTTAEDLRAELSAVVEWLAVDKPSHRRYQPGGGNTYCNIYAHDYCHLAGAYLPRVWWTPGAIEALAKGESVAPKYACTVEEMRANSLFRWLRDFGLRFGWRQTGTATKLQTEVNQGAVGLIVARRVEEGRSGHIVAVVPETDTHRAKRDAEGEVTAPLQSQAGAVNFRYGTSKAGWWMGEQFAESAFWIHA